MTIKLYDTVTVKHFEGDITGVVVDITPRHYIVYDKSARSIIMASKEMVAEVNGGATFIDSHPLTVLTGKVVFDKDRFPGFEDAVREVVHSCIQGVLNAQDRSAIFYGKVYDEKE